MTSREYGAQADASAKAGAQAREAIPSNALARDLIFKGMPTDDRVRAYYDTRTNVSHWPCAYNVRAASTAKGQIDLMADQASRWPSRLWIVRHGESAGNVARQAAQASGSTHIAITGRDVDVPLSARGIDQSRALGKWFASQPEAQRPEVVLASPYLRVRHTVDLIREVGGLIAEAPPTVLDERLREREFGILDRLTKAGIQALHPQQAQFRAVLGKFYHRPPGGESWCDVILRLRGAVDTLSLHYPGRRVLIVAHEVVVMCLRYLLEDLDEECLMAIDSEGDVANCGVTEYLYDPAAGAFGGALVLKRYNMTAPLEREGATVTDAPDAKIAAR